MMKKVSININGHQSSFSIEPEFLSMLKEIAKDKGRSIKRLVSDIDDKKGKSNLSSAIRVFVLKNK